MTRFECTNCRAINYVVGHGQADDEYITFTTGLFASPVGELTWCRVCGVVQKLSVVLSQTMPQPSTTPHAQHQCPACEAKRIHTDEEFKEFHSHAGEGMDNFGQLRRRRDATGDVPGGTGSV